MEFNWDEFKKDDEYLLVVNCQTKEESENFINCCKSNGITQWKSGEPLKNDAFEFFGDKICYLAVKDEDDIKLTFDNLSYFNNPELDVDVLNWNEYMKEDNDFCLNDIKAGYVVGLHDGSLRMVINISDEELGLFAYQKSPTPLSDYHLSRDKFSFVTSNTNYNIERIYGYPDKLSKRLISEENRELLFPIIKRMTLDEIEKELGYKIELIEEQLKE